ARLFQPAAMHRGRGPARPACLLTVPTRSGIMAGAKFGLQLHPRLGYTDDVRRCRRGGHGMTTTVERLPDHPARVVLEVEVEPERVEQAVDRVYRRVVRDLRIPGFRKGRAPRKIVEMYLGKDALLQEAIEELVPAAYREAAKQA